MAPTYTTLEVAAMRRLGRHADEGWVDWAIDRLAKGANSDALCSLAALTPPFNTFEMAELVDEGLRDLGASVVATERKAATIIATQEIRRALAGEQSFELTLVILERLCIELDYLGELYVFYDLSCARSSWEYGISSEWLGLNPTMEHIHRVVEAEFRTWLTKHAVDF